VEDLDGVGGLGNGWIEGKVVSAAGAGESSGYEALLAWGTGHNISRMTSSANKVGSVRMHSGATGSVTGLEWVYTQPALSKHCIVVNL
jgi:hypothetical protein